MNAKRRASGLDGSPAITDRIFSRYSHITAKIEPSWIITVKTPPGSLKPIRRSPISRCAVDETGRNSVSPCRTPRSAALTRVGMGGRKLELKSEKVEVKV